MFRRREETLPAYSHPFPQAMYPSASIKTRNNTATDAVLPLPIHAAKRVTAAKKSEKYREVTDSSALASKRTHTQEILWIAIAHFTDLDHKTKGRRLFSCLPLTIPFA